MKKTDNMSYLVGVTSLIYLTHSQVAANHWLLSHIVANQWLILLLHLLLLFICARKFIQNKKINFQSSLYLIYIYLVIPSKLNVFRKWYGLVYFIILSLLVLLIV